MSGSGDLFDAVRKVVGDKPLYLLAGASDLLNEKLRELPDAVNAWQAEHRDAPIRAASTLVGQAFKANLKVGALYDDLTRRGEQVVAKMRGEPVYDEEDEPFVHEPFMPEPVHAAPVAVPDDGETAVEKPAAKKPPAVKAPRQPGKKAPAKTMARKATAKKTTTKESTSSAKAAGAAKSTRASKATKSTVARKSTKKTS